MEVSFVVYDFFHDSFNGKPVGMHVGDGHKDGDHQSAVVEVLVFFHFFNHHDSSVCRCDHSSFRVSSKLSNGTTEEV